MGGVGVGGVVGGLGGVGVFGVGVGGGLGARAGPSRFIYIPFSPFIPPPHAQYFYLLHNARFSHFTHRSITYTFFESDTPRI